MTYQIYSLLICLFVFFGFATPSNALETNSRAEIELTEIEAQLKAQEAQFSDIVDGTEKHIHWFKTAQETTEYSIVYLHGFSASRQELSPLVERLANGLHANVFYTRLQGHGRSDDAMGEGSVDGWKQDALEAYTIGQLIGDKVIIVGTSTGATLSTWLNAQQVGQNIYANIHISPNFGVQSSTAFLMKSSFGLWIAKLLNGDYRSFEPMNEFHKKYWTERYPLEALVPMLELVDEVGEMDKAQIRTPQLIVYSPADKVIDVDKVSQTASEMKSAQVTKIEFTISQDPYQHVLVGEASSTDQVDDMLKIIDDFLSKIAQ